MLQATLRASVVLLFLAGARSGLQAQRPLEPLRRELEARTARHYDVIGLAVIDLRSGDTLTVRGHDRFPTASVIKLPILVEVFHQMRYGRLRWDDPLVMTDADRVPGAGILQHYRPNDCGIVFAPQREYVLCAFSRENVDRRWTLDNEAAVLIAELSRLVYDALTARR